MMTIRLSSKFKKDFKRVKKQSDSGYSEKNVVIVPDSSYK